MAPRALVLGYGNIDRQDDGAAFAVVNALRQRLGQAPLEAGETGLESLGQAPDSAFVVQLGPELLDVLAAYERVCFVDAHVQPGWADVHQASIQPEYSPSAFTHHMTPGMLLALLKALHQLEPQGYLVSIRGHQFDFERGLTSATERLVAPAVDEILGLLVAS
jgi:hydrogenase maturation protease